MQKKNAVSLIVLVITIIVMIILAGVIVLTLNNSGIIEQAQGAVDKTNLNEVQTLASLKWAEAYMDGNTTQNALQTEVLKRLNEEKIDLTPYEITVTDEGVKVALKGNTNTPIIPETWKANVIDIVDTVPIPKGFVASSATGENIKNGGLVIYEGTEAVTDANVEDAKRTRNQYVWVPVEDFSKFVRQNFGNSYTISNTLGTDYWEVVLDTTTNMPLSTQSTSYVTSTTLAEVQAMYESVKEYKGFYIARYEAGVDKKRTPGNYKDENGNVIIEYNMYSVMGKIPYTYIPWTATGSISNDTIGAVQVARSIYSSTNSNYGAVSTLTYGVQWDATLQWWLDTKAVLSVTNSYDYGNYVDRIIQAEELNDNAMYAVFSTETASLGVYKSITETSIKASGTGWALSTGALKASKVNNIYDMAGNMYESTMEGASSGSRISRGGTFNYSSSKFPVICRNNTLPNDVYRLLGFRPCLYIKL
ncbi:MAG: hypothetical protein IJ272_03195 [Clostridia bacterium]|nr:hypothetical protein [Clostridia bacterium]